MASQFLGSGWNFPIQVGKHQQIEPASNEAKIYQSIWMILTTAPGERVMRSDFGCGIHNLVFENFGDAMIGQVRNEVAQALAKWEPRIDVLGIDVKTDQSEPNLLLI